MTAMTEREGPGDAKGNVEDELDEAATNRGREKDAAPEEEEQTGGSGGSGGVKGNVEDEQRRTQER